MKRTRPSVGAQSHQKAGQRDVRPSQAIEQALTSCISCAPWRLKSAEMPPVMPYVTLGSFFEAFGILWKLRNHFTGDASFYPPLRKKGRSERSVLLHRLIVAPENGIEAHRSRAFHNEMRRLGLVAHRGGEHAL